MRHPANWDVPGQGGDRSGEGDRAVRAKVPLLMLVGVLLLLAVLATSGGSAVPHGRGFVLNGGEVAPRAAPPASGATNLPGRLNTIVGVGLSTTVALALIAYLIGLLMFIVLLTTIRFRRRRRERERISDTGDDAVGEDGLVTSTLLRGTRSALAGLRQRSSGPPGDAVQRAWLALEEAAAESGTRRRPDQTSTEFTSAVLAQHTVDPAALATLRGLYQRARFGAPDSVTEADADTAIAALDRIADTLSASVGAAL
jgi:hypothetical protein